MNIPFIGGALRRRDLQLSPRPETGLVKTLLLYTESGPIPASLLSPGDKVIRRGRGPALVREVQFETFAGRMIRIAPDAFGRARPEDFVLLPPEQKILLRNFKSAHPNDAPRDGLFRLRELVDDAQICWHQPDAPVELVHIGFDGPQVVHAGGLELAIGD